MTTRLKIAAALNTLDQERPAVELVDILEVLCGQYGCEETRYELEIAARHYCEGRGLEVPEWAKE